jgi:hypothetical protein
MLAQFRKEIMFLGHDQFARLVCAAGDDRSVERFVRTLKVSLLSVRTFKTIEDPSCYCRPLREMD